MSFKICIVGCGEHATAVHGCSLERYAREHSDTILAACCDINEQKAKVFKEKFGFKRCYRDFIEMLNSEKPDAVGLASPPQFTASLAAKILEMGYPLILEKPPGLNIDETGKLIEIAEKNKVPNRVAFNRRYTPMIRELKKLLNKTTEPSGIQSIQYDLFRIDRLEKEFSETAIHAIDAVRFIAGSDYKYIRFHYQDFPQIGEGVKNIYMDCSLISGATARISLCPVAGAVIERTVVNAHDNTFFLNTPMWDGFDSPGRLIHLYKGQVQVDVSGEQISDGNEVFESGGFYFEDATFFDAIRSGKIPEGDLKTALQSVDVADCISRRLAEYHI